MFAIAPKKQLPSEQGSAMAWTAIFIALVVVPLLSLVVDGGRLFYVRGRLQTATDAACEDAAWSAADRRAFREAGETVFRDEALLAAQAQSTFIQSLGEQAVMQFSAGLRIAFDSTSARVTCFSYAEVPLVTTLGLAWSPVRLETNSAAAVRFTN